jgi:meso-butanediol dehydrogenase/(S,S)-butanediol dehydrogenase/diacetyl reductase
MSHDTAIVTGGSRGIGRAIVDRLLADGSQVLTCGRGERPPNLQPEVSWVTADVSVPSNAEMLVLRAEEIYGPVSLLVNNAGVQLEKPSLNQPTMTGTF